MSEVIPAISLWQPWASLWLTPYKLDETRHWTAPRAVIGKRLAVHAARRPIGTLDLDPILEKICEDAFGPGWLKNLPRGAVLGTVRLESSRRIGPHGALPETDENFACGDWTPGRFAWRGADKRLFAQPVPLKGRQGFFTFDMALAQPPANVERQAHG